MINGTFEPRVRITVENEANPRYFQLKVERAGTKTTLFNMGSHSPFIFAEGHIEITTQLTNDLIYGLGQSNQDTFRLNFSKPQVGDTRSVPPGS